MESSQPQRSSASKPLASVEPRDSARPKPPPLPRRQAATLLPTDPVDTNDVEPVPPPVAVASPTAQASEALDPVAGLDYRPSLVSRAMRRLQSTASFGISVAVHVAIVVLLSLFMIQEKLQEILVIEARAPSEVAELEEMIPETLTLDDLHLDEPTFDPSAMGLEMDEFLTPSEMTTDSLDSIAPLDPAGLIDDGAMRDSLAEFMGAGKFGVQGGLYDDSFDGMVEYARDNGLDIVIAFDSTGSMGGEIEVVKTRIAKIGMTLLRKVPNARISLCTYRDAGDDYVSHGIPLTNDLELIMAWLSPVHAGGGGDTPEAVQEGLGYAIKQNNFRRKARKVVLIFGDAPPHAEHQATCEALADEFHRYERGIVTTITVRNGAPLAEFQRIAKIGGGSSFAMADTRLLMEELVVQVFGEKHRAEAMKFFELAK